MFNSSRRIPLAILAIITAVVGAWFLNKYYLYVLSLAMVNAIAAMGLVVVSGIGGQINLATAAVMGIGAYAMGILVVHLGLPYVVAVLAAVVVATAVGTLLAAPALRLTPIHLAIATLAFGIIVMQMIGKGDWLTGGMAGLTLPKLTLAGLPLTAGITTFLWIFAWFIAAVAMTMRFAGTKAGRALLVIRENEQTARSIGINTSLYKMLAFGYSSALAGLAGALYAPLIGFVSIDDFTLLHSIYFFLMIAIGGMVSITGGVIGAVLVTMLPEALRGLQQASNAIFGVLLFIVLAFMPRGVVPIINAIDRWLFRDD